MLQRQFFTFDMDKMLSPSNKLHEIQAQKIQLRQTDLNFQCGIMCTALGCCTRYNIEVKQYKLRVHQFECCPCDPPTPATLECPSVCRLESLLFISIALYWVQIKLLLLLLLL